MYGFKPPPTYVLYNEDAGINFRDLVSNVGSSFGRRRFILTAERFGVKGKTKKMQWVTVKPVSRPALTSVDLSDCQLLFRGSTIITRFISQCLCLYARFFFPVVQE